MTTHHRLSWRLLPPLLVLALQTAETCADWISLAPLDIARTAPAAALASGRLLAVGGIAADNQAIDIPESLNLASPAAWESQPAQPPIAGAQVSVMSALGADDNVFVVGSVTKTKPPRLLFIDKFNPANQVWTKISRRALNRIPVATLAYRDRLLLVESNSAKPSRPLIIETYQPSKKIWRKLAQLRNPPEASAIALVGDSLYFFGGNARESALSTGRVSALNLKSLRWATTGMTPMPTPRAFPHTQTAPVINGRIYLIGGEATVESGTTASAKVEIYDPASDTWQAGPALPQGLSEHAAVATEAGLYVIGGKTSSSLALSEVWSLADVWKSSLLNDETYDLNADGNADAADLALFDRACRLHTAYWQCDLNGDLRYDDKDLDLHSAASRNDAEGILARLFINQESGIQVAGSGVVSKVLSDDLSGDRHQRFILELTTGQTLLMAHNIDIAPRLNGIGVGDSVSFYGQYEWNREGGVVHWTHQDPGGSHVDGWLNWNGTTYQ